MILVTGGAGYIGSQTCKALAKAGFTPVTYDNLSTGHAYAVKWGPFVQGDLLDTELLKETIRLYQPKAVLHFAASALVLESIEKPAHYYKNNLLGTFSLLDAMRECGLLHCIFSSSCATYGTAQFTPITEEHPQVPINPYGRSKLMAEQIMADFDKAYGLKTISLRYFNAAGADLDTQIGENHHPETHLIPSIIQTALGQKSHISVYGTDFPTPDGSAIRDYIHIQDLADAHVRALQYLLETKKSDAINLGSGRGFSVLELINAVSEFCGASINVKLENRRIGEPSNLTADARKARELLGWVPNYSNLSTIIESAWKWHQLLFDKSPVLFEAMQRIDQPTKFMNASAIEK